MDYGKSTVKLCFQLFLDVLRACRSALFELLVGYLEDSLSFTASAIEAMEDFSHVLDIKSKLNDLSVLAVVMTTKIHVMIDSFLENQVL